MNTKITFTPFDFVAMQQFLYHLSQFVKAHFIRDKRANDLALLVLIDPTFHRKFQIPVEYKFRGKKEKKITFTPAQLKAFYLICQEDLDREIFPSNPILDYHLQQIFAKVDRVLT